MESLDLMAPELFFLVFAVPPIYGREEQLWYEHWSAQWWVLLAIGDLYL